MAVEDPLGVLNIDPKKLELIRKFFKEYAGDASALNKELQAVGRELGFIAEKTTEAVKAERVLEQLYQARARAEGDINKILSSNKQIRDEELKSEQAALVQAEQAFIKLKERQELVKEELKNKAKLLKENKEEYKLQKEILEDRYTAGQMQLKEFEEAMKQNRKKAVARARYLGSLDKEKTKLALLAREEKKKALKQAEEVENKEKINKGFDTSIGLLDGIIEKTGFFSEKWKTGPLGGVHDFLEAGGDLNDLFDELSLKLNKINLKNFAANTLKIIGEGTLKFLKQFDKLAADFRKNTGIIDRGFDGMEQRIVNVQRANLRMGVTMEEAFGAQSALVSGMAQFTSMTDDARDQVLRATAIMQEFGVSASTTADIFNTFSKGLGFNSEQLEKLSTQIMGIATSLKIPPQIIATEFNAASKELMKYGDDMVNVFKGIAEQSKQTGIAMGELLGIVKEFDTFEGAGAAVGKLNAILGGPYLNSINMLYATEEDRVKMLRESVALSGKQFNQLSRFEQQAIATAAGISDMSVAARLFGGTNSEFAKTQMSMKEMQERAAKAQAVQEKFTQVMQSFAIALGPVVHLLGFVADGFLMVMNPVGEIIRMFGSDNSGLIGMFGAITPLIYAAGAAMSLFNVQLFAAKTSMAEIFLPITTALVVFGAFKSMLDSMEPGLRTIVGLFIGIAGAIALALAIPSLGGSLLALAAAGAGVGAITAGIYGVVSGIGEFAVGKPPGQSVGGGAALVGEKGQEMVVTEDGSRYMVNSPSVMALDKNDTVYTNAETKAMLNGGGGNSAALAQMRASQEQFMQSMREERSMLQKSISEMASRPLVTKLDGKTIYKNQKEYLQKDPSLRIV